jgi:hypothetical protein
MAKTARAKMMAEIAMANANAYRLSCMCASWPAPQTRNKSPAGEAGRAVQDQRNERILALGAYGYLTSSLGSVPGVPGFARASKPKPLPASAVSEYRAAERGKRGA